MEIFRQQLPRHGVNYYYSISAKEPRDLDGNDNCTVGCSDAAHIITGRPSLVFIVRQTTNKNINKNREKHYYGSLSAQVGWAGSGTAPVAKGSLLF